MLSLLARVTLTLPSLQGSDFRAGICLHVPLGPDPREVLLFPLPPQASQEFYWGGSFLMPGQIVFFPLISWPDSGWTAAVDYRGFLLVFSILVLSTERFLYAEISNLNTSIDLRLEFSGIYLLLSISIPDFVEP